MRDPRPLLLVVLVVSVFRRLQARSQAAASRRPARPSRASAPTAAGRFRTSLPTCVLARLGVPHRSRVPSTRLTPPTTAQTKSSSRGAAVAAAAGTLNGFEANGHPSDEWGWAAMAGLRLNAPMIGVGDYLQLQGIYTQGAL